ncbi:MAG: hypothetical protein AB7T37_11575 [Dehalococcoidia bacterium]
MLSAAGYLLAGQAADGHWSDYQLPVGESDAWVTAYVAVALTRLRVQQAAGVGAAVQAAVRWLIANPAHPAGWGYNAATGPDADTTAHVLHLLKAASTPHDVRADETWLLGMWRPAGGFATYPRDDAWGRPHPDVTPVAFLALSEPARRALRPAVVEVLSASRDEFGGWPSYWWRTAHYATLQAARAIKQDGLELAAPAPIVHESGTRAIYGDFDLACLAGIAAVGGHAAAAGLAAALVSRQMVDGSWPGSLSLRVTDPECEQPWLHPLGRLYTDQHGYITTATALRVLADLDS